MTTIKDVAEAAGVSTATVSRVFSDPERVADDTRKKVMSVVDALNYAPNFAAKSLRTNNSRKILVTVPDISNPFFSSVIRGVEEAARFEGYSVVLGDTRHEREREDQYAEMLLRREVDGLIFLGHRLPQPTADLQKREGASAPIVNGCEYSDALPVSSVHIDNRAAGQVAADYLYSLGHESLGIITGPMNSPLSRDRLDGVKEAARARGLGKRLEVRECDFSLDGGARETRSLLSLANRPTAIFCFSDEMAIGALSAVWEAGLRCPADVSVMGFDDIRTSRFVNPPLTTIAQPMFEIGYEASRLVIDIIEGRTKKRQSVTLRHSIVIRESTAPPGAAPS